MPLAAVQRVADCGGGVDVLTAVQQARKCKRANGVRPGVVTVMGDPDVVGPRGQAVGEKKDPRSVPERYSIQICVNRVAVCIKQLSVNIHCLTHGPHDDVRGFGDVETEVVLIA